MFCFTYEAYLSIDHMMWVQMLLLSNMPFKMKLSRLDRLNLRCKSCTGCIVHSDAQFQCSPLTQTVRPCIPPLYTFNARFMAHASPFPLQNSPNLGIKTCLIRHKSDPGIDVDPFELCRRHRYAKS